MEQEPKTGYFFVLLRLENDGMTLTSVYYDFQFFLKIMVGH